MRTFFGSLSLARSFNTTSICKKQEDLVSNLFVKQIRELAVKQKAAGGSLVNTSPELKKKLDEQLNRLAQKFKLANSEVVSKLAVEFEKPNVQSSVSAVTENRNLDDFINEVFFIIKILFI